MITYQVTNALRDSATGLIKEVRWAALVKDGDVSFVHCNRTPVTPKDPSDPTFINYENLDEQTMLSWVLGTIDQADYEDQLNKVLESKKHPEIVEGVPWVKEV